MTYLGEGYIKLMWQNILFILSVPLFRQCSFCRQDGSSKRLGTGRKEGNV